MYIKEANLTTSTLLDCGYCIVKKQINELLTFLCGTELSDMLMTLTKVTRLGDLDGKSVLLALTPEGDVGYIGRDDLRDDLWFKYNNHDAKNAANEAESFTDIVAPSQLRERLFKTLSGKKLAVDITRLNSTGDTYRAIITPAWSESSGAFKRLVIDVCYITIQQSSIDYVQYMDLYTSILHLRFRWDTDHSTLISVSELEDCEQKKGETTKMRLEENMDAAEIVAKHYEETLKGKKFLIATRILECGVPVAYFIDFEPSETNKIRELLSLGCDKIELHVSPELGTPTQLRIHRNDLIFIFDPHEDGLARYYTLDSIVVKN